jgi:hypothetical protein
MVVPPPKWCCLAYAIEKSWLWKHEFGNYVKFTKTGADLFA